ncbi:MAG: hypothetical protein HY257_05755 [Chloroflexi bacterium]|nr:hypothetical protein [Chloroflexota bacterium]
MPNRKNKSRVKKKIAQRASTRKSTPRKKIVRAKKTALRVVAPPAKPATEEYRDYLDRYRLSGKGRPRLNPTEFEKMDNELIDILTIQTEVGALADEQIVRLQELEYLLLESD